MNLTMILLLSLAVENGPAAGRMLDRKLNVAQRNNACYELRGNASAESVEAAAKGLRDPQIRGCAAQNLRAANAVEPLKLALQDEDPEVRAAAVRILGTLERADLAPLIAATALDGQLLVAANAIEGLSNYRDGSVVQPYLLQLAKRSGIVGSLAAEQLIRLAAPEAAAIGRELLASPEPADLLTAMRLLGALGSESDIPALAQIAKRYPETSTTTAARGFGLMPSINLGKAADAAIEQIRRASSNAGMARE